MIKKVLLMSILVVLILVALTACVPSDGTHSDSNPAGFFWGVWHGWIAPISLVMGLTNKNIRVYEAINTGWWYDFGFYMAVISGFGGLSLFRRKKDKKKDE